MKSEENLLDQIRNTYFTSEDEVITTNKITWELIGELRYQSFQTLVKVGKSNLFSDTIESYIDELETRAI